MELVDEEAHLALAYIHAVTRSSARLKPADLEAYLEGPTRRQGMARPTLAMQRVIQTMAAAFKDFDVERLPAETVVDFLVRVRWIEDPPNEYLVLTPIGRAMLAEAERPPAPDAHDEPMVVEIDPKDPVAYLRVFQLMSAHGAGMLVDPYLDVQGLSDLAQISQVNRVLTSARKTSKRLEFLSRVAPNAPEIEIRTADASALHDRFFFPDAGPVYVLGSSLNSISKRPGVITPVSDSGAAGAIRDVYERLWKGAAPLPSTSDDGPPVQ